MRLLTAPPITGRPVAMTKDTALELAKAKAEQIAIGSNGNVSLAPLDAEPSP